MTPFFYVFQPAPQWGHTLEIQKYCDDVLDIIDRRGLGFETGSIGEIPATAAKYGVAAVPCIVATRQNDGSVIARRYGTAPMHVVEEWLGTLQNRC